MKSFARNTFGTLQFQSFKKLLHKCWRKGPSLLSLLFWKFKIKTYVYFFSCKSEKHCSFWTQQTLPSELIFDQQASCTLPTFSTSSHTYTILSTGSLSVQGDYQSCMYRCVHFAITLRIFQYFSRASFSLTLSVDLMIMTTFSIFLIISVAIERYLAVCRPHHYREIQTDSSRSWWWSVHMRFFYWTFSFN